MSLLKGTAPGTIPVRDDFRFLDFSVFEIAVCFLIVADFFSALTLIPPCVLRGLLSDGGRRQSL